MSVRALAWTAVILAGLLACKPKPTGGGSSAIPSGAVPVNVALPAPAPAAILSPIPAASAPATFADLTSHIDPSVVFVQTVLERRALSGRRQEIGEGLGSAFVFDPNGLILTNNHVIENASQITVTFGRKRRMNATVVGRDPPTDLAILRVEAKDLPFVSLGDSDAVRVGDWVIAIGNPFGLSHTVSAGIISAKGRTIEDVKGLNEAGYYDFLQTDASINPGNSGGPLLDMGGRVVGINTAIRAQANSIGFAIPVNMVKELLPKLLKDGKITRSAIGVSVASLMPEDLERLGLHEEDGALVRSIVPGGPADRAGLRPDDVVLGFGGQPITSPNRLRWLASLGGVGATVPLRVARGSRTFDIKVTLSALNVQAEAEPEGFPGLP